MLLLILLSQIFCSVVIVYDQKNNITQSTANTITFNITATFPSSSDIAIVVQLPPQITGQESIVCGVSGLTNGACNLVYSKFYITFKSATPTFQIIFINVNNPLTTYTEPVQMNASVIATSASIFSQQVQLTFQYKIIPITITQPTTTYAIAPLLINIDGTTSSFPTKSLITISTTGIVPSSTSISGVNFDSLTVKNGQINFNAQLTSTQITINITQFLIQSTQPISYTIAIQDSNLGYVSQYSTQQTISQVNNNYPYTLQSSNLVIGLPTNMSIVVCNLAESSTLIFSSSMNFQYSTSYGSGCHNTIFNTFNNPLSVNPVQINMKVTLNNYNSIQQTISYVPTIDTMVMSLSQNTTVMLNYALVILTLQFNQQFSDFIIQLTNQYQTNSCTIQDIDCTLQNNIYSSSVMTTLSKVTIRLEILLPGCDTYFFTANLLQQSQIIAQSNSVTPTMTKYKLGLVLETSSYDIGQQTTFTINNVDSTIITAYYVTTDLNDPQCDSCIQNTNLQFGQVNTIQFTAKNNINIKPYTITIQAYKDLCLIASQTFTQSAIAQPLSLSVTTDNNYHLAQGQWKVIIAPDMQDKGILSVPIQLPETIENRINTSAVYINQTTNIFNLTNIYNVQDTNFWSISYFKNGYLYAYGNTTLNKLDIMGFSNFQITKENTLIPETENITVTFNTSYDIPINGNIVISANNLPLTNVTLNGSEYNNQVALPSGQYQFQFQVELSNTTQNTITDTFNLTSYDDQGRILQFTSQSYNFNYNCTIDSCGLCTFSECLKCKTNFTLLNNTCNLVCKVNQTIVNNICKDIQTNTTTNTTTNTDPQTPILVTETPNTFTFTPPIISPIVVLIFLFSISRKCWNRESETFIIFYSMASILEHIIHVFLFIYFFATQQILYGFCMISVIVIHFSSQLYIVFMNLFKIDPEYIGIRQQYNGLKILHVLSLTFCGRLLLLLISKLDQSYIWSTPWTYKISVLQRLTNYLIFLIIEQLGAGTLVVLSLLNDMYFFYIEILSFQIIQIVVTIYTINYLCNQKNIEIRLTYV